MIVFCNVQYPQYSGCFCLCLCFFYSWWLGSHSLLLFFGGEDGQLGLYSNDSGEFWIMGYIKTGFHLIDEPLFRLGVTDEWGIVCDSAYYKPLSLRVKLLRRAYSIERMVDL